MVRIVRWNGFCWLWSSLLSGFFWLRWLMVCVGLFVVWERFMLFCFEMVFGWGVVMILCCVM